MHTGFDPEQVVTVLPPYFILTENRSHIGMIVMSTVLDTQDKVISLYGGKTWTKIEGRFLIGADASTYKVGNTGGSSTHTITTNEIPSHSHSIPALSGTANSNGAHTHSINETFPLHWESSISNKSPWATPWNQSGNIANGSAGTTSSGSHTHTVTTTASNTGKTGSGTAMSILNPYKAVYIWERTA